MGIHEFICQATKQDKNCIATFDLSKSLEKQKQKLEKESLQQKAISSGIILCYNQF